MMTKWELYSLLLFLLVLFSMLYLHLHFALLHETELIKTVLVLQYDDAIRVRSSRYK